MLLTLLITLTCCKEKKNTNSEQVKMDIELKNKLEIVLIKDQGIREIVNGNLSDERKSELLIQMNISEMDIEGNRKFDLMSEIDSINITEIEAIINEYGYPSKSLVGEPANKAVFYVVQHSDKINKYLPLIRKATQNGDIAQTSLAMMEDRGLMEQGREQIYGTQIKGKANKQGEWIYFLWPIKNVDSINMWRKQVGFEQNIEEYLKDMDVEFELYKVSEVGDL